MICTVTRKRGWSIFENNMRILNLPLFSVLYITTAFIAGAQHLCWITNMHHLWSADGANPKYCASVPVTICPPHTPRGMPWDRTRNFAVRGWRLTIRAMARPFSVHARQSIHTAGTDFQTWPVGHDTALCGPSQAICTAVSTDPFSRDDSGWPWHSTRPTLLARWQRMTLPFHRNQYYNALMLTGSQHRQCRLLSSCFCPPPLTGVTQYTHAIFVYFTFLFFPNSSRYTAFAPRTNYLVLRHNHKPQRHSVYV
jgi:hypothetical protein